MLTTPSLPVVWTVPGANERTSDTPFLPCNLIKDWTGASTSFPAGHSNRWTLPFLSPTINTKLSRQLETAAGVLGTNTALVNQSDPGRKVGLKKFHWLHSTLFWVHIESLHVEIDFFGQAQIFFGQALFRIEQVQNKFGQAPNMMISHTNYQCF